MAFSIKNFSLLHSSSTKKKKKKKKVAVEKVRDRVFFRIPEGRAWLGFLFRQT